MGRILPHEPGDPRSDSGVVKTLDSSVLMVQSVRYTQGASPDDETGSGRVRVRVQQSDGWQKSVGRISIVAKDESQDESRNHDLARVNSPFRKRNSPQVLTRTVTETMANGCAGSRAKSLKTRREGWVLKRRKLPEGFSIRWKASWIVGGLPFTG